VQVRIELDNPDLTLKPGMFASVTLEKTLPGDKVVVPRAAVIDTGKRAIAFVSKGDGKFEPREVETGLETEAGQLEIRSGLEAGEMVVTSGQFLLDSEAKVREGLARMMKGELAKDQAPVANVAGAAEIDSLPPAADAALGEMLDAYLVIADRYAGDTADGTKEAAAKVAEAVRALTAVPIEGAPARGDPADRAARLRARRGPGPRGGADEAREAE
jgi:hypothetical protein